MAGRAIAGRVARGYLLWKALRWLGRKLGPRIERRLARKSRTFMDEALRNRQKPRPA